ncbi:hypothetical protein [Leptospira interrogans]|nr:hypothetical protein [Leptospira interrogans]
MGRVLGRSAIVFYNKDDYCIIFSVCSLLTRTESQSITCGKPDSPSFSYVELTLKYFV